MERTLAMGFLLFEITFPSFMLFLVSIMPCVQNRKYNRKLSEKIGEIIMKLCPKCKLAAECRFRSYLKEMNMDLKGNILDIACGPFSLGCIYEKVQGHDNSQKFVRNLEKMGIPANLADIRHLNYPSKSFRYVVTFNPPLTPFREREDIRFGIKTFLEDMLRIAQDKVIIKSGPMMSLLPSEYDSLIERKGDNYVIYNAQYHFFGSETAMQNDDSMTTSSI